MKFLKQADYIKYINQNYQNMSKSACGPPQIPFLQRIIFK